MASAWERFDWPVPSLNEIRIHQYRPKDLGSNCQIINSKCSTTSTKFSKKYYGNWDSKSSSRNRLARSTVNREVVGSIPTEDVNLYDFITTKKLLKKQNASSVGIEPTTSRLTVERANRLRHEDLHATFLNWHQIPEIILINSFKIKSLILLDLVLTLVMNRRNDEKSGFNSGTQIMLIGFCTLNYVSFA